MNAIVGLCHFCEAHGPRPLFCTFTTDDKEHTTESSKSSVQCSGCTSLGPETVYVSKDDDGTIFCSRESVPNTDVTAFLRQAAIRSITCEVNWSKEGGIVYFSDTHGHVLSLTFQVKDTWARGLKRWFSIVVLMKDKMLLLNITPLLSDHMQKISKELQAMANVVYDAEQKVCSQRALRLRTGRNDFGQSRSLIHLTDKQEYSRISHALLAAPSTAERIELLTTILIDVLYSILDGADLHIPYNFGTIELFNAMAQQYYNGSEDVFKNLHSHFTWMLKAGAHTYSETLYTSQDLLKKLQPQALKNSIFDPSTCSVSSNEECMSLRSLDQLLSKSVFRILIFCTLTGVNIVIKSSTIQAENIVEGLKRLLPVNKINYPLIRQANDKETILPATCLVEETQSSYFSCKWKGILPVKCPTLMNRIENAMSNDKFNSDVLHQYVRSLQLEWLGTAKAVKAAAESSGQRSDAVRKLKQVFGVGQHDEPLLSHWMTVFCD